MIVSLPATTLNDKASGAYRSCPVTANAKTVFAQTPSIKTLMEHVRVRSKRTSVQSDKGDGVSGTSTSNSTSCESSRIKPEDDVVIAVVEQTQPTLDQKQVVKAIAGHLVSLLDASSVLPEFEGQQTPSISVHDYVDRLIRYVDAWAGDRPSIASTGVSAALMAIEYLDRLNCGVSAKSVHRLYMCAVLVAVKFSEDFCISNRFWAKVAGIDLEEMNRLEVSFCNMLSWKLRVSREEFESQQVRFAEPVF